MDDQKIAAEQLEPAVPTVGAMARKVWKTPQVLLGTLGEAEVIGGPNNDSAASGS